MATDVPLLLLPINEITALNAIATATDEDGFLAARTDSPIDQALQALVGRGFAETTGPEIPKATRYRITDAGRTENARRERRR